MVGYNVEILKTNLSLTLEQQHHILDVWNNLLHSNQVLPKNVGYIQEQIEHIEQYNPAIVEDYLNVLGFIHEKKSSILKITYFDGPESCQRFFFEAIAEIISPGSYVTWKGEDEIIFGWFFNGKLIDYDSKSALSSLRKPFELQKKLDKALPIKSPNSKKLKL